MISITKFKGLCPATFVKFVLVGIAATATYFCLSLALVSMNRFDPFTVNFLALTISILVSYVGHHKFTFKKQGSHAFYFPRFLFTTLISLVYSNGIVFVVVYSLKQSVSLSTTIVTVTYPILSFTMHLLWTFASRKEYISQPTKECRECN